jgi:hypothetical protein
MCYEQFWFITILRYVGLCSLVYKKVKVIPWHAYAGTEGRRKYSSNPFGIQH